MKKTLRVAIASAALLAGPTLVGLATPAAASGGSGAVIRTGNCSGAADWKLKAKPDDGRLEVEFELDTNRNGQTWAVTITDNGTSVFSGNRTTVAPSGSFEIEIHPANRTGADRIVATARRGGQTCTGTVTI